MKTYYLDIDRIDHLDTDKFGSNTDDLARAISIGVVDGKDLLYELRAILVAVSKTSPIVKNMGYVLNSSTGILYIVVSAYIDPNNKKHIVFLQRKDS